MQGEMQTQAIVDSVFCGISLVCSVTQCLLIVYLVRGNGWVFSMFLQLSLAMAIVVTLNRSISFLDIFFTSLPPSIQENQAYLRIMYGFLDISFLPFMYFFLITAFCIDLLLNFALHYRSARHLHRWYIPASFMVSFLISTPILAWHGELGTDHHLYIVDGNWAQRHYHIITLTVVIVICTCASVALVGAGFWCTIREWRGLRREIDGLVLPISESNQSLDNNGWRQYPWTGRRRGSNALSCSPDSLDRLYYGRKVSRSIYYLAMYPIINLLVHLGTGVGQIVVYAYPDEKWSKSMRDFSNDSVGILLLVVFVCNPAFVQSKLRQRPNATGM
ncbi:hypothetical protein GQ54DRAFT_197480 [Martensiomyces pterosporus]|nr:hypothetical protein GQ54DRAFT_197480 [Martensiomyces pterosporus]